MTKDEQDALSKAYASYTPAQQAEFNAMSQNQMLDSAKALLQGYRDTRDFGNKAQNDQYNHDLTVQAKTAQFGADSEQALANIQRTAQNMAMITGMS